MKAIEELTLRIGLGFLSLCLLYIIHDLAKQSGLGKLGIVVLYVVLGYMIFGVIGRAAMIRLFGL